VSETPARPSAGGGPLLERERELDSLDALIGEALAGRAHVALIEGPAGIGKTSLMSETRRRAARAGVRVLSARAAELERDFPFGVVRQLFEPCLVEAKARARALRGAARASQTVFEAAGEVGGEPAEDPSFASLHGLYWLTVNLSAQGALLLAIDDLHWCDRPSLRYLAYLVRRLEGLPVLVACTMRPAEPGVAPALLGDIASDPLTVTARPGPLSEPAVEQLVRERLGRDADHSFAEACHTATGGNPLLLSELLKTLAAESVDPDSASAGIVADLGPRAASRAVLLRLARLPEEAVAVAHAVAVLGDGVSLATVAALADTDERRAGDGVTALVRAEILLDEPALAFVHPLVGGAVYRDVPAAERAFQHERAARLLAEAGAPVERVAAHLLSAPARGDVWVLDTLRRAAVAALKKGGAESAVAYLTRALAEPPPQEQRPGVLLQVGNAEAMTNGPAAVEHLREAFETLEDPRARGMAAQVLGRALLFTGHPAEGAEVARQAAAELPDELGDLKRALEALELIAVAEFGVGDGEGLARLERYRSGLVDEGVGARMLAAVAALDWAYAGGSAEQCAGLALEALAGGELIAADNGLLAISAIYVLVLADRDEALDAWDSSLAEAHRRGSLFQMASITLWRGFTMYWRGELAEAEDALLTARDEFQLRGFGPLQSQIYCDAYLAAVMRERGDLGGARRALERSAGTGDASGGAISWLISRLELLLAEGRFDEVLPAADDFARRQGPVLNPTDAPWRSHKAQALDRLGRPDEARALVGEELELARGWGSPRAIAQTLRVLGLLERERGIGRLHEAVELVAGSPAKLEHAKSLAALGSALRLARKPKEAREPLRRALELADRCGARGLADHVRSELYAAGGRPRRTALSGVESLTASEQRVATLAADGAVNREIAETLFVTPKTVEIHLSAVYRKLGIRSRRELPGALSLGS
jgi:DNA-binding CsgD family transcriptional regulator